MKVRNVIFRAALLGFSGLALTAYAGLDMKVRGSLIVGACNADFGGSDDHDYGDIVLSSLSSTVWNNLPQKISTLTIDCPDAVKNSAFYAVDSDHGSAIRGPRGGVIDGEPIAGGHTDDDFNFGLGRNGQDTPLGNFSITPTKVTVDGVEMSSVSITRSHTDTTKFPILNPIKRWSYMQGEDWAAADGKGNRPAGIELYGLWSWSHRSVLPLT